MTPVAANQASGATTRDFLSIAKALADKSRVRMLLALRGTELCLCQLAELVRLAPSTASKHMSILRDAGLVEGRKVGRWMHYRLAGEEASPLVQRTLTWMIDFLAGDPLAAKDAERLEEILSTDPRALCGSGLPVGRSGRAAGKSVGRRS